MGPVGAVWGKRPTTKISWDCPFKETGSRDFYLIFLLSFHPIYLTLQRPHIFIEKLVLLRYPWTISIYFELSHRYSNLKSTPYCIPHQGVMTPQWCIQSEERLKTPRWLHSVVYANESLCGFPNLQAHVRPFQGASSYFQKNLYIWSSTCWCMHGELIFVPLGPIFNFVNFIVGVAKNLVMDHRIKYMLGHSSGAHVVVAYLKVIHLYMWSMYLYGLNLMLCTQYHYKICHTNIRENGIMQYIW